MIPLRVAQVIGTTSGGTGSHVVMLAAGGQVQGLTVSVIGPAAGTGAVLRHCGDLPAR